MAENDLLKSIDVKLSALLALGALLLSEDGKKQKPEVVLRSAGLSVQSIAQVLGKKSNTVKKAIQRSK